MTVSVFIGTSLDGFIARPNGDLDFLPEDGGEPHGYNEFFAGVDALVIGRKTFEKVLTFEAWPYGDKRIVVLSSRPVDLSVAGGGVVEQMAGSPAEIVSQPLRRRGDHDPGVPARGAHSTSHHHSRACSHWRGDSSVRSASARRAAPSHSDSALSERLGSERVPGCRLTIARKTKRSVLSLRVQRSNEDSRWAHLDSTHELDQGVRVAVCPFPAQLRRIGGESFRQHFVTRLSRLM